MRKILVFVVVLLGSSAAWGQQRPQYTLYMMNNYLLNPAITGIEDYTDVKIGSRQQWVGLEGAPKTYFFSAHTPLNKETRTAKSKGSKSGKPGSTRRVNYNRFVKPYPHHGLGVMAVSDKTGPLTRSNLTLSYAYHVPLNKYVTLATGVAGGLLRNSFNPQLASFVVEQDPAITSQYVNFSYFDTSVGTWLYGEDFFFGLSGAQLLRSKEDVNLVGTNTGARMQQHFFATGGFKASITRELTLVPSVMVKLASPSPASIDVNLKAIYADRLWVGGSYRTRDAFSGMVGVNVSYLMEIGYAYDLNSSNLNVANSGSHEIVLGLKLFNRGKVICPHWLH